ncbi:hypothetical protein FPV67DRAFT_1469122 [Lyophyllum atratum]|nr:hypothetical protein FPV67DRAFT_1469122 [Lyophyllum atratum]
MTDYAQIITHSPEQVIEWRKIASSNPDRVIRTLGLQAGRSTREGDTQADIYPAMAVLKELSRESKDGVENRVWVGLVDAGIAEALCKSVLEMVIAIKFLPNMPRELLDKVKKEMQSPYFLALEVLCNASCRFQYPPTKTDKRIIAALRKNWADMMDRIWNEPENTLRPEESHIAERMVVAQMVMKILITDPSFVSIFYEPSDLTVQIVARHWKHALNGPDILLTGTLLGMLIKPEHPRHVAYVASNGLESGTSRLLSKIFVGVGPAGLASKAKQSKALMTAFADHLVRITGRPAEIETDFVLHITKAAQTDRAEPELVNAVLTSTPFWNAMFRLLKKSATPAKDDGPMGPVDPGYEKATRLHVMRNIVGASTNILHKASFDNPRECESLARIWGNENLFGALEETIELLVGIPGMTMQLSRLAGVLEPIVSNGTPSLLRLYQTQFPRWRIFGRLIRYDAEQQQVVGPPSGPMPGKIPAPDDSMWNHSAWQVFGSLQNLCIVESQCGKRGCEKPGEILCMCEAVKYCSEACKTKDAKDHLIACGWMAMLDQVGIRKPGKQSVPPPAQTSKNKKKTTQPSTAKSASQSSAGTGLEELD